MGGKVCYDGEKGWRLGERMEVVSVIVSACFVC